MRDIYVVAHPESIHHIEKKVGGWFDTGLTEAGRQQATRIAKMLQELLKSEVPAITSSDLLRTKDTAEVIADSFGCDYRVTPDLREMSYGIAEGKPQDWLDERILAVPDNDDDRLDHRVVEGAESRREFATRVFRAVDDIIANDHPNHVIVTHGFAVTFVVARWIGMSVEATGFVNFRSLPGGITHLHQDDLFCNRGVRFLNNTSHLVK